ncbi:MAG: DoxX family protein [Sphingomonas bacterium]|uniref:hypothetical protein n=1 Tax=Sphingomonas bacterium TaxID=1895847 RepID=UPI002638BF9A|nr:hypothetical protein [Sphingomonas bacterium]MDB5706839.1 DoxX family protein [Sphingomonas bacterium]
MNRRQSRVIDLDGVPLGIGAIGLGVLGLVSHDFAFQWQPVPASWPGHAALAIVSAVVLILGGAAILTRRTVLAGAGALAFWFGLWAVMLHLPVVVGAPSVASLLGLAEIGAIAMGAAQLLALRGGRRVPGWVQPGSRIVFGLCAIVFGVSHFVYAEFTAAMVPGWIPGHLFWAYATGACHVAAGVAILAGVRVWLAGTLLAAMAGGFVLLLHLPRVVATPSSRMEWTMMFVALSIAGAAWVMRLSTKPVRGGFGR